jgi:hypothetical protein
MPGAGSCTVGKTACIKALVVNSSIATMSNPQQSHRLKSALVLSDNLVKGV